MAEKEIVLDLSKIIKFSSTVYISLGTFILSLIIVAIQCLICLASNNWQFSVDMLAVLLNFVLALRVGDFEDEKIDE